MNLLDFAPYILFGIVAATIALLGGIREGSKADPLPNWAYYAVALTIAIAAVVVAMKILGWLK